MISEKNILILKKNIIKAKDLGYKYIAHAKSSVRKFGGKEQD